MVKNLIIKFGRLILDAIVAISFIIAVGGKIKFPYRKIKLP